MLGGLNRPGSEASGQKSPDAERKLCDRLVVHLGGQRPMACSQADPYDELDDVVEPWARRIVRFRRELTASSAPAVQIAEPVNGHREDGSVRRQAI